MLEYSILLISGLTQRPSDSIYAPVNQTIIGSENGLRLFSVDTIWTSAD